MKTFLNDKLVTLVGVIIGLLLMQACSPHIDSEESCNFVQNSFAQRVSWENNEPMQLYIDDSMPTVYYDAIHSAANKWNEAARKTLIKVIETNKGSATPSKDGVSKIYMMDTWDESMPNEQARTTVHWRGNILGEADVRINAKNFTFYLNESDYNWSAVHFESLVLHELGHALGLAHNESEASIMRTSLAQGISRDTVGQEDLSSLSCEYH